MAESEKSKKKRLQKAINITEYQLDKKKEQFTAQEWRRVYILAQNFLSPHLQKKDLKKEYTKFRKYDEEKKEALIA